MIPNLLYSVTGGIGVLSAYLTYQWDKDKIFYYFNHALENPVETIFETTMAATIMSCYLGLDVSTPTWMSPLVYGSVMCLETVKEAVSIDLSWQAIKGFGKNAVNYCTTEFSS